MRRNWAESALRNGELSPVPALAMRMSTGPRAAAACFTAAKTALSSVTSAIACPWACPAAEKTKKNPVPKNDAAVAAGKKATADKACTACHGETGKGEFGTYFIGYSRTAAVTERMLTNMFIGDPPGNTDRILDFSTAVTGNLFFAPSADFLDDLPALPDQPAPAMTSSPSTPASAPAADGSLGIGGLKRSSQQ